MHIEYNISFSYSTVQFAVEDPRHEVEVIFDGKYLTMGAGPQVLISGFYLWLVLCQYMVFIGRDGFEKPLVSLFLANSSKHGYSIWRYILPSKVC